MILKITVVFLHKMIIILFNFNKKIFLKINFQINLLQIKILKILLIKHLLLAMS